MELEHTLGLPVQLHLNRPYHISEALAYPSYPIAKAPPPFPEGPMRVQQLFELPQRLFTRFCQILQVLSMNE